MVSAVGVSTVGSLFAVNKLAAAFPLSLRLQGPLSLLHWLPVVGGLAGLLIETLADTQKSSYRADPKNGSHWCDIGVWKMCRYPNYFGEMLIWWSLYGLCVPALSVPLAAVSVISPLFVTWLLVKVSGIPLLEIMNDKKYKDNAEYTKYKNSTPMLLPNFFLLLKNNEKKE